VGVDGISLPFVILTTALMPSRCWIFRCIYGFFLGTLVEIVHRRAPIEGGGRALFSVLEIGAVIAT